jgi:hypothetical protein
VQSAVRLHSTFAKCGEWESSLKQIDVINLFPRVGRTAFKRAVEVMGGRGSLVVLHVTEVVTTSVLDPFHDTLDHLQNVEAQETATHVRKKFEGLCHSASPKVLTPLHAAHDTRQRAHTIHPPSTPHAGNNFQPANSWVLMNTRPHLGAPVGV